MEAFPVSLATAVEGYSVFALFIFALAEMHTIRKWRQRFVPWIESARTQSRPIFHWKYSGVAIPVFFGTGVAMALADKFLMAYVFFALFGVWSIAYWLTSDTLTRMRKRLLTRSVRRDVKLLLQETRKYCIYESGVCVLIICVTGGFIVWTLGIKREGQRADAFRNLTATVDESAEDPMQSTFTITNGSNQEISQLHGVTCFTHLAIGNYQTSSLKGFYSWILNRANSKAMQMSGIPQTFERGPAEYTIKAGGDAQSDACLAYWGFQYGTDCADVTVMFWYSLETQPDVHQEKDFRFVARKVSANRYSWHRESVSNKAGYCDSYQVDLNISDLPKPGQPWFKGSIAGQCYMHPKRRKAKFWMREVPTHGKSCFVPMSDEDSIGSIYEAEDDVEKQGGGIVELEPNSIRAGTHMRLERKYGDVSLAVSQHKSQ